MGAKEKSRKADDKKTKPKYEHKREKKRMDENERFEGVSEKSKKYNKTEAGQRKKRIRGSKGGGSNEGARGERRGEIEDMEGGKRDGRIHDKRNAR